MKQFDDIRMLGKVSSLQWGLFTTAQAAKIGVDRLQLSRLSERNHIERLSFGVYRMAGSPKSQFEDIKVAWLSADAEKFLTERQNEREKGIVVSGHTAAYLYGAGDLQPTPYLFVAPFRKQTQKEEICFRKRIINSQDITFIEGLPVTTPEITITTLAAEGEDLSQIADVVSEMSKIRNINKVQLSETLGPYAKKYGFKQQEGWAFVEYLFSEVSQSKARDLSKDFQESIENMKRGSAYESFLKNGEIIRKFLESPGDKAVISMDSKTVHNLNSTQVRAIKRQVEIIETLLESPSYKAIVFQQNQIEKYLNSPEIKAIGEQSREIEKFIELSGYKESAG